MTWYSHEMNGAVRHALRKGGHIAVMAEIAHPWGSEFFWSGHGSLAHGGETFTGAGQLGQIGPMEQSAELAIQNIEFSISGVPINRDTDPRWAPVPATWVLGQPQTVRGMTSRQGELYVGVGSDGSDDGEIYVLKATGLQQFAAGFGVTRVNVLQSDDAGNLYIGVGTSGDAGAALFARYDADDNFEALKDFPTHDYIYSFCWHQGKLHFGTMMDSTLGIEQVWRFDNPGFTQIAGPGLNGWPNTLKYRGIYELWSHGGNLYALTYGDASPNGDVFRFDGSTWVDMAAPACLIAIAAATWRGDLIVAFQGLAEPIRRLKNGVWETVGSVPAAWSGASLANHILVDPADRYLYVGLGGYPVGQPGLSVWRTEDGEAWEKVAGGELFSSWDEPLAVVGVEWIYRMHFHDGALYSGIASNVDEVGQVWRMLPPTLDALIGTWLKNVRNAEMRAALAAIDNSGRVIGDPYLLVGSIADYPKLAIDDGGSSRIGLVGQAGFWTLERAVDVAWSTEEGRKDYPLSSDETGFDLIPSLISKEV